MHDKAVNCEAYCLENYVAWFSKQIFRFAISKGCSSSCQWCNWSN